jgi:hypothetical protein
VAFKLLSGVGPEELVAAAARLEAASGANLVAANDWQAVRAGQQALHLVRGGRLLETLEPGPDLADRLVDRVLGWATAAIAQAEPIPLDGDEPDA